MKTIYTLIFILSLNFSLFSQGEAIKTQFGIAGVPHYLIRGGIRLDFDKQLMKPNHWLVFAPQIYWFDNPEAYIRNYRKKIGAGLNAYHKIFITKDYDRPHGFYGMYGVGFQYYYLESDYYDFNVDQWFEKEVEVYQGEVNLCIGHQWMFSDAVFIDAYMGFRTKLNNLRFSNNDSDIETWQDSDFYPAFVSGIRLGVIFPGNFK